MAVSVAGNVGHFEPPPGHPVILADRLTAAASPVAAFAGLTIGLLVLKMTCQRPALRQHPATAAAESSTHVADGRTQSCLAADSATPVLAGQHPAIMQPFAQTGTTADSPAGQQPVEPQSNGDSPSSPDPGPGTSERQALLRDACLIYQAAVSKGEHVSQRRLASQLRGHGHRFSNQHLQAIAASAGLGTRRVA
jgi:hypothetical protein